MSFSIDVSWKSLNKQGEELCGDKVEVLKTEDSDIVILADGMGSGVKANILATLTSKILGTMLREGASIESCVETVAKTLPICKIRKVAYATFSILQIFHSGEAYLAEFDNPSCVFIRDGKIVKYPYEVREIEGKKVHESRFQVKKNDCFTLMSDGVIYAGAGSILNLQGWTWEAMSEYTLKCTKKTLSASRLAVMLCQACDELYEEKPGDDTTVAVARVIERRVVSIFTGPPAKKEDDERIIHDFMHSEGKKVISGGTSANIAARVLGKEIVTEISTAGSDVPPTAVIEGIDLVTEGVLTLGKCLKLLKKYVRGEFDEEFFDELDADNGASRLAKLLIEECTELNLFVGTAVNEAHKETELNFELSMRQNLVEQLVKTMEAMEKRVTVKYY
ncbi:SpoIIE family protein phosphatase [Mediterraneibacter glycyrrhizinilyticus]|uniref:SpoIIE family protein phosphatase n=1 Tax=Mediterraneibacter glycyrrhizinilyticus TaxID=342942 RepID=UPI00195F6BB0|nr:SpoIIE family protein phosphatase [Mediterraneibacter glycyrrhizinilyticus]MBM6751942.1 SpoIIE family protein phosphatase [Mediterraneibacter glycyrrhizinilyticus]